MNATAGETFHVLIHTGPHQYVLVINQSEERVKERFVSPWLNGEAVVARGRHFNPGNYWFEIYRGTHRGKQPDEVITAVDIRFHDEEVTDAFITAPFGSARPGSSQDAQVSPAENPKKVVVIHGRNEQVRKSMFEFLRSLGLEPLEWSKLVAETQIASPYIGQVLDEAFKLAQAAVVVSTPDDQARLAPSLVPDGDPENESVVEGQARPNVFLEAGMALGRFPSRTILTQCGKVREASDLHGRHVIHLNQGPECRKELANRLRNVGCDVDESGTDWLSVGVFEVPSDDSEGFDSQPERQDNFGERAAALIDDLPEEVVYVPWSIAMIYNDLVEESGLESCKRAVQQEKTVIDTQGGYEPRSHMTSSEMRTQLNQIVIRRKQSTA